MAALRRALCRARTYQRTRLPRPTARLLATDAATAAQPPARPAINLNADLAEGFGPWTMTADEALMDIVTSANIACGGHAGDATIMARALECAFTRGVSVGSHPGYDDKAGFGRRVIPLQLSEIEELVAFQTGALLGMVGLVRERNASFAAVQTARVTHIKPHGALNNVACVNSDVAAAIVRAVVGVDRDLIMLAPAASELLHAAERAGLRCASEVFADRRYMADGTLAPRALEGAVIHEPAEAIEHALQLAAGHPIRALDTGEELILRADSICVHGDKPSAVQQAQGVRDALVASGFELCTLPELFD